MIDSQFQELYVNRSHNFSGNGHDRDDHISYCILDTNKRERNHKGKSRTDIFNILYKTQRAEINKPKI